MEKIIEYSRQELAAALPPLSPDANKYSRGKLVVVAGSARYPGAACLAACAAQRAGAGYVQVMCDPRSVPVVQACRSSLVAMSWEGLRASDLPSAKPGRPAACVVGPGFDGVDNAQRELSLKVARLAQAPALVDGGALSAFASAEGRMIGESRAAEGLATVLTPHAGEAARLAKAARIEGLVEGELASALARAYRCIVVLKGPDTFVSDGERTALVACGTPALAKAGTGDVLAGIAGALLAQGAPAFEASVLAAHLHAQAGCACEGRMPARCVVPEDVIEAIPAAIANL